MYGLLVAAYNPKHQARQLSLRRFPGYGFPARLTATEVQRTNGEDKPARLTKRMPFPFLTRAGTVVKDMPDLFLPVGEF